MRVAPGVALVDDEVNVDNVQRLAQSLEQMQRVGVATYQEITQSASSLLAVVT